jgi:hypothetical protein
MPLPLLVHLVFHPGSTTARALAIDPAVPVQRVSIVIVPEDDTNLPPRRYELREAERNVVVVLADGGLAGPAPRRQGDRATRAGCSTSRRSCSALRPQVAKQ